MTLHSGERRLTVWGDDVPMTQSWTSQGGFKLDGTPHGVRDERTGRLKIGDGVSESDDEEDSTTDEENGTLEVLKESGSSDSEMDWTIDEKMEGLNVSDGPDDTDGETE